MYFNNIWNSNIAGNIYNTSKSTKIVNNNSMGSVRNMRTINYYVISNNKGYIDSNIKNVLDISSFRYENSNHES